MSKENNLKKTEETALKLLQSLTSNGICSENTAAFGTSLNTNDVFEVVTVRPISDKVDKDFTALVVVTDLGASIGVKHFQNVEISDECPKMGRTFKEVANFFGYCIAEKVRFKVTTVKELPQKTYNGQAYTPKEYTLEVVEE